MPSAYWWLALFLLTIEEGASFFLLPLQEEGGGHMGFYEIASLVLQAATLFVGILALRASRKK